MRSPHLPTVPWHLAPLGAVWCFLPALLPISQGVQGAQDAKDAVWCRGWGFDELSYCMHLVDMRDGKAFDFCVTRLVHDLRHVCSGQLRPSVGSGGSGPPHGELNKKSLLSKEGRGCPDVCILVQHCDARPGRLPDGTLWAPETGPGWPPFPQLTVAGASRPRHSLPVKASPSPYSQGDRRTRCSCSLSSRVSRTMQGE